MSVIATLPCPDPGLVVHFETRELTFIGAPDQPDFATLTIIYTPGQRMAELKSLKKYVQSWREKLASYERICSTIYEDFQRDVQPTDLTVIVACEPRGGTKTTVRKSSLGKLEDPFDEWVSSH